MKFCILQKKQKNLQPHQSAQQFVIEFLTVVKETAAKYSQTLVYYVWKLCSQLEHQ